MELDFKRKNSHIEEALRKYESKREQIYKELEIAYVQDKIRRKLISKEESSKKIEEPIEFLFYQEQIISSEDDLVSLDLDKDVTASENATEDQSSIKEVESVSAEVVERRNTKSREMKVSKYLDIEADVSGEYENDSFIDNDGFSYEAEYIDNDVESNINLDLFVDERERNDNQILQDLKEKFVKKKVKKAEFKVDPLAFESNDEFPEIAELSLEQSEMMAEYSAEVDQKVTISHIKDEGPKRFLFQEEPLFNNDAEVLQRITKKDDKKVAGFVEKKN